MLGWASANPLLFTTTAWTWLVLSPALGIALLLLLAGGLSVCTRRGDATSEAHLDHAVSVGVSLDHHQ